MLVVERHAGTSPFPKATGISTRTMELLRGWGLERAGARRGDAGPSRCLSVSDTLAGPSWPHESFGYPTAEQALAVSPATPVFARRTTSSRCCWTTCSSAAARSGSTPS